MFFFSWLAVSRRPVVHFSSHWREAEKNLDSAWRNKIFSRSYGNMPFLLEEFQSPGNSRFSASIQLWNSNIEITDQDIKTLRRSCSKFHTCIFTENLVYSTGDFLKNAFGKFENPSGTSQNILGLNKNKVIKKSQFWL